MIWIYIIAILMQVMTKIKQLINKLLLNIFDVCDIEKKFNWLQKNKIYIIKKYIKNLPYKCRIKVSLQVFPHYLQNNHYKVQKMCHLGVYAESLLYDLYRENENNEKRDYIHFNSEH